jgi:tRNA(adenine34) deaminase
MSSFPLPSPMQLALQIAREAAAEGEVPVGAVISRKGKIIATGGNLTRTNCDPTAHAEIVAIREAARLLDRDRLEDCDLWVTLEPCAMCAGAISHARIARLYYAADDPKGGAIGYGPRFFQQATCHHRPEVYTDIGQQEASSLLRDFFRDKR